LHLFTRTAFGDFDGFVRNVLSYCGFHRVCEEYGLVVKIPVLFILRKESMEKFGSCHWSQHSEYEIDDVKGIFYMKNWNLCSINS
jgi:hypothetical protein